VGLDHLFRLDSRESRGSFDDQLPDAHLFRFESVLNYLEDITLFPATGKFPDDYTPTQKRHMVICVSDYQLIVRQ